MTLADKGLQSPAMVLSTDELTFLARFAKSPDAKALVSILQGKLGDVEGKLRRAEGAEMHRCQGRAQQLDELLADIRDAEMRLHTSTAQSTASRRFRQVLVGQ